MPTIRHPSGTRLNTLCQSRNKLLAGETVITDKPVSNPVCCKFAHHSLFDNLRVCRLVLGGTRVV